ncbi:MAG: hypothetical protein Q4A96_03380 [Candidatus Saccharibacteria bacterium]|nr:hypothetical protein [Candidatus Saccharibacteria bacterium]
MATKTNTKTTRQKIFASNRPFISRVTIDGMIIGALGLIMAWASVYCFTNFLKVQDTKSNFITSASSFEAENIADDEYRDLVLNSETPEALVMKKQFENSKLLQDISIQENLRDDMHFFFILSVLFGSLAMAIFVADFVYVNHASIRLAQKM